AASACALRLFPGGTGTIEFAAHTDSLPLAGIQGAIFTAPPLQITDIRPIGPAAGMHLVLQRDNVGGIGFVLFADSGAPIPRGAGTPILAVTVLADSAAQAPGTAIVGVTLR